MQFWIRDIKSGWPPFLVESAAAPIAKSKASNDSLSLKHLSHVHTYILILLKNILHKDFFCFQMPQKIVVISTWCCGKTLLKAISCLHFCASPIFSIAMPTFNLKCKENRKAFVRSTCASEWLQTLFFNFSPVLVPFFLCTSFESKSGQRKWYFDGNTCLGMAASQAQFRPQNGVCSTESTFLCLSETETWMHGICSTESTFFGPTWN